MSLVAIQGTGTNSGQLASVATLTPPTTVGGLPATWTSLGDWPCTPPSDWVASNSYTALPTPSLIQPRLNNAGGYTFIPTTNCTSGATEPASWSQTFGGTTSDGAGACTWKNVGTFDIHMAAAYRKATSVDGPDAVVGPWTFSDAFYGSVVNIVYNRLISTSASPIDIKGTAKCTAVTTSGSLVQPNTIIPPGTDDFIVGYYGVGGFLGKHQDLTETADNVLENQSSEPNSGNGPAIRPAYNFSQAIALPDWAASNAYGAPPGPVAPVLILPTVGNSGGYVFETTTNCTSGATEPASWIQTIGNSTSDNTCTWTNKGLPGVGGIPYIQVSLPLFDQSAVTTVQTGEGVAVLIAFKPL